MKENKIAPTDSELEILQILWQTEPATIRAVHEVLAVKRNIGYTTTLKQFQRMTEKGMLKKSGSGKAHLYHTLVKPEAIQSNMLDKLLQTAFNGSTANLVLQALGKGKTSEEELVELEKYIQSMKKKSNG